MRKLVELGAGIRDRGELSPAAAGALPEVLEVGARLDRRARLRGGEEKRLLQIDAPLQPADRFRVRRVEHVERLDVERPPQHLRGQRRAAHAEQDAVVELLGRGLREGVQLVDVDADPRDDVEPAEPAVLARVGPERGVVGPDPLDERAHSRSSGGKAATSAPGPAPSSLRRFTRRRARPAWRGSRRAAPRTSRRTSARPRPRASRRRRRSRRRPPPAARSASGPLRRLRAGSPA